MALSLSSSTLQNSLIFSSSHSNIQTHESTLNLLSNSKNLDEIKQLHCHVIKTGLRNSRANLGKLAELYALSDHALGLSHALSILHALENPTAFTWNTVSLALTRRPGASSHAPLWLYVSMLISGSEPNSHTFPILFKLCGSKAMIKEGSEIHAQALKLGLCSDQFVGSSLIGMYSNVGDLSSAQKVFDEMPVRNNVCFTALMTGYASRGFVDEARRVFDAMGEIRDVVAWNAMASGLVQSGRFNEAFEFFRDMLRDESVRPNESTICTILSGCAQSRDVETGNWVRKWAEKKGLGSRVRVVNSLVDMYSKFGDLYEAREIFDGMSERNVVSWNVMIGGYTRNNDHKEALSLFSLMLRSNFEPNDVTFLSILPACAHLGALEIGKWIHTYIDRNLGTSFNGPLVRTSLVDMYAKCGDIEAAKHAFEGIKVKTLATWNAMISGFAMSGHADKAFELFSKMLEEGFEPDDITFIAVLSACNHSKSINIARGYFESMVRDHKILPKLQHYGIMIDILGRAGLFEEAEALIESMEMKPDGAIWGSLLGACRVHNKVELGQSIAEKVFELEPENPGPYVLLSNIYAKAEKWDEVAKIRTRLHEKGLKKIPGCTSIEVDNVVHEFLVGDKVHPMSEEIYEMVDEIDALLEKSGFVPDTSEVLYDMDEEFKEGKLSHHSERLAIAFGLIGTKPGTAIRIVKNLRVCRNCHSATKLISKIFDREIIARDRNRFHRFKDGFCSCNDNW